MEEGVVCVDERWGCSKESEIDEEASDNAPIIVDNVDESDGCGVEEVFDVSANLRFVLSFADVCVSVLKGVDEDDTADIAPLLTNGFGVTTEIEGTADCCEEERVVAEAASYC